MLVATPHRTPTKHDSFLPKVGHVGGRGASRAAHPAKLRVELHELQDARARKGEGTTTGVPYPPKRRGDIIMDTKYASGARQKSTQPLQPLAGVRVVAFVLGHSGEKKEKLLCSRAQTQVINWAAHPA